MFTFDREALNGWGWTAYNLEVIVYITKSRIKKADVHEKCFANVFKLQKFSGIKKIKIEVIFRRVELKTQDTAFTRHLYSFYIFVVIRGFCLSSKLSLTHENSFFSSSSICNSFFSDFQLPPSSSFTTIFASVIFAFSRHILGPQQAGYTYRVITK